MDDGCQQQHAVAGRVAAVPIAAVEDQMSRDDDYVSSAAEDVALSGDAKVAPMRNHQLHQNEKRTKKLNCERPQHHGDQQPHQEPYQQQHQHDALPSINAKLDVAAAFFDAANYRSCYRACTQALKMIGATDPHTQPLPDERRSEVLFARAICLFQLGVYDAAVKDLKSALSLKQEDHLWRVRSLIVIGHAYLKCGHHAMSIKSFNDAQSTAEVAAKSDHAKKYCEELSFKIEFGRAEVERLKDALEMAIQHGHVTELTKALEQVNIALSIAPADVEVIEKKLMILSSLQEWREVIKICELFAAHQVVRDGLFMEEEDLVDCQNPLFGLPPAQFLKVDSVTLDNSSSLSRLEGAEAVIRLPASIAEIYIRALRLEEHDSVCFFALHGYAEWAMKTNNTEPNWLTQQRRKFDMTIALTTAGNALFQNGAFEQASQKFVEALTIDSGTSDHPNASVGGRLHAVLHSNLASCLMERGLYHDAIEASTNALRSIGGRIFKKPLLVRARCYVRTQQLIPATSDYCQWLNFQDSERTILVEEVEKELADVEEARRRLVDEPNTEPEVQADDPVIVDVDDDYGGDDDTGLVGYGNRVGDVLNPLVSSIVAWDPDCPATPYEQNREPRLLPSASLLSYETADLLNAFECPLCYQTLKNTRRGRLCHHRYCSKCIMEAMRYKQECPLCRTSITRRELVKDEAFDNLITLLLAGSASTIK